MRKAGRYLFEQLGHEVQSAGSVMVGDGKTETSVKPKDTTEDSLGTDETKIKKKNHFKANVKPKIKQHKELEGWYIDGGGDSGK